ncbi:TetR/AcrR family transcriptional regulator [Clostridium estertheticum]|uniref:TetR/AcrR family transcriptional regulator n=1 Tax=Clostridium estertheticum TaxID=238834 RepID=UPI001CF5F6CB|nr:TetR/AcrR family transcriptional regulator [Clostridium estertheticum]MCB2309384.1 TetR/AcrR family transcriptional regulator [Clostridium estertheticum]MCB2347831.1 TetR/AcrR family transcriptional regulator [Clostridium estertheticum]MCB2352350.1 TetR/AcrR family transcriptional regulator [Clostridium estertheticum]WAG48322.1 TetR/AcrR family transcriptional regulator [Clostridium estertheticum]
MTEKNKGNQKSEKSKMWMENTLIKLMETEVYNEITIQEITDNAGLSRRTFYRNYSSKEEIIEQLFVKIWNEYEVLITSQDDLSMPNVTRVFFTIMTRHIDFLLIVNHHHLLPIFLTKVDELLPPIFYETKGKTMPFNKESISYALSFGTGGLMRILIKWLNDDQRKSPDEMALIVNDMMLILNYQKTYS